MRRTRRLFLGLLLAVAVLSFLSGCQPQTRYEVLSFFFTGVPTPEEEARRRAQEGVLGAPEEAKTDASSEHDYFVAGTCDACHYIQRGRQSDSGSKSIKSNMPSIFFESDGSRGSGDEQNLMRVKKNCVDCHSNKSETFASENQLWLHAPVTREFCQVCHVPHRSNYPRLLKEEAATLCTMCHSEGLIRFTAEHREMKGCLECHTAHLGKDSKLLKKDYQETPQLPNVEELRPEDPGVDQPG